MGCAQPRSVAYLDRILPDIGFHDFFQTKEKLTSERVTYNHELSATPSEHKEKYVVLIFSEIFYII